MKGEIFMNKLFTKIAAVSLSLAMAVGVGVAVGSNSKGAGRVDAATGLTKDVAYTDFSGGTQSTGSSINASNSSPFTVNLDKGYKNTSYTHNYANGSITITGDSSVTAITGVVITASSSSYNGMQSSGAWSVTSGGGSISGSGTTITYSNGTASSCKLKHTKQLRFTNIKITYNTASTVEATGMTITPSTSTTVYAGESVTFTPALTGGSGSYEKTISWTSSNTSVVAKPADSEDGTAVTVTTLAAGSTTITGTVVSPGSATQSITITANAPKTLGSISVATAPTKTTYSEGEKFDPTGLVINRVYTDSTSDTYSYANHTSDFTFSPSTTTDLTTSDTSVTITYGGKSTTQAIIVNEVTKYELITDASGLVAGCDYLIGNASQTKFMSTTQNGNNRGVHTLSGSVSNNKVGFEEGMEVVTLGGSSGAWTLYANNSETAGYLYLPSNNNYLRTQASSFGWGISFSNGTPSISATVTSERWIKYNSSNSIFACYTSGQEDISLWKEVSTAESITISKDSLSGLKGDSDNTVSITASNFTPTNIEVSYSTSGVASVTKGTINDGVIPLNVSYTGAGETTATITVKGGTTDYTVDLAISVAAKPAVGTLVAKHNSVVVSSAVECITGSHVQFTFAAEDTDGNPYSVAAGDLKLTIQSGAAYGTAYGTTGINGTAAGTVVARFALKVLETVYVDVTVNVVDDYIETVGTPTFATGLTAEQGESPVVGVFTSRPGTMHSGTSTEIPFADYLFSYTNSYASAEPATTFSYDFSHGTTVDSTHKSQTIYVFCTIGETACGSYTITVEQLDDPLTAITITNVTGNAKEIVRGGSFQLEIAYTPTNPTDGKEVTYRVDDYDEGVSVSVNSTGLISVAASSGLGEALVVVESSHDATIYDYVYVTVTLESMTYIVSEDESWTKVTDASTLSAGDVIIVTSESKGKVMGTFSGTNKFANEGTATFDSGTASSISGALEFTLETGSSSGTWKLKNGSSYLYGTSTKTTLCLSETATDFTISISDGNATIDAGGDCRILHNVGSTRFSNYTSATSASMLLPQIYRKSGGDTPMTVTAELFNAIHNNFGLGKTYEWSESCPSFDEDAWFDACYEIVSLANYSDYKLNLAVANASGNEVEYFLAKYDVIVGKFGTTHDYLGRFDVGGINYGAARVTPQTIFDLNSGTTTAIIVIVSLVSLTAIGGYFAIRKRKEQ